MELALSLGNRGVENNNNNNMGFRMGIGFKGSSSSSSSSSKSANKLGEDQDEMMIREYDHKLASSSSSDPSAATTAAETAAETAAMTVTAAVALPLQLDLLPFSPVPRPTQPPRLRFPWLSDNLSSEPGSSSGPAGSRMVEVNRRPAAVEAVAAEEVEEEQSSPNSETSSFMEFSLYTTRTNNDIISGGKEGGENGNNGNNYGQEVMGLVVERGATTSSRGSDDEEINGSTRKKLRLSKEQSAFLEESFKEQHTLNPKQKLALAKQLNLRPRQVEVWFQNRRARTKLKQTEVDCEYLKRCCETLTEENRRLQKELQELRALKTSQPFFMHLPPTTLTMCPSCERVAPTSTSAPATSTATAATSSSTANGTIADATTLSLGTPKPKPKPMLAVAQV